MKTYFTSESVTRGHPDKVCAQIADAGLADILASAPDARETDALMPLSITLANRLTRRLEQVRREKLLPYLLPDGKAQVSVEYEDGTPKRISAVVVSAQHSAEVGIDALRDAILEQVIFPVLPPELLDEHTEYFINPTGRFVVGGPAGDSGVTGREIIADAYGG